MNPEKIFPGKFARSVLAVAVAVSLSACFDDDDDDGDSSRPSTPDTVMVEASAVIEQDPDTREYRAESVQSIGTYSDESGDEVTIAAATVEADNAIIAELFPDANGSNLWLGIFEEFPLDTLVTVRTVSQACFIDDSGINVNSNCGEDNDGDGEPDFDVILVSEPQEKFIDSDDFSEEDLVLDTQVLRNEANNNPILSPQIISMSGISNGQVVGGSQNEISVTILSNRSGTCKVGALNGAISVEGAGSDCVLDDSGEQVIDFLYVAPSNNPDDEPPVTEDTLVLGASYDELGINNVVHLDLVVTEDEPPEEDVPPVIVDLNATPGDDSSTCTSEGDSLKLTAETVPVSTSGDLAHLWEITVGAEGSSLSDAKLNPTYLCDYDRFSEYTITYTATDIESELSASSSRVLPAEEAVEPVVPLDRISFATNVEADPGTGYVSGKTIPKTGPGPAEQARASRAYTPVSGGNLLNHYTFSFASTSTNNDLALVNIYLQNDSGDLATIGYLIGGEWGDFQYKFEVVSGPGQDRLLEFEEFLTEFGDWTVRRFIDGADIGNFFWRSSSSSSIVETGSDWTITEYTVEVDSVEPVVPLERIAGAENVTIDPVTGFVSGETIPQKGAGLLPGDQAKASRAYTQVSGDNTLSEYEFSFDSTSPDNDYAFVNIYLLPEPDSKTTETLSIIYFIGSEWGVERTGKYQIPGDSGSQFVDQPTLLTEYGDWTVRIFPDNQTIGNFFWRSSDSGNIDAQGSSWTITDYTAELK